MKNKGKLIVDATCTPADIRYPTDMSILNEARMKTESFIDYLYYEFRELFDKKPRDYREVAHRDFIEYTKKRKPRSKVRRKALKKQLNYLKRNIKYIEEVLCKIDVKKLKKKHPLFKLILRYQTIKTVYEQQSYMYRNKVNRVENRIVSISQPHVRPIVRGKAGKNVEFGAKISLSLIDGFSFVDHLSWDSFNEAKDLIPQIKKYKERTGYYPASVHADKIYQNRENRKFCRDNNIRMSGKPLGRPKKVTDKNKDQLEKEKQQRYQDDIDRIAVEGRFGVGKRKYGLGLIKSKLKETGETDINVSILVLNLDKICAEELAEIKNKYRINRENAA